MIIEPSVEKMLEKVDDRYDLAMAVAKRARQIIAERSEEHSDVDQRDSVKVAVDEIDNGDLIVTIDDYEKGE